MDKKTSDAIKKIESKAPGVLVGAFGKLQRINNEGKLEDIGDNLLITLSRPSEDEFAFFVTLFNGEKPMLQQPVTFDMNLDFSKKGHHMEWITLVKDSIHAWRFVFANQEQENVIKTSLAVALHEVTRQEDIKKTVKEEDHNYLVQAYEGEMELASEDEAEEDEEEKDKAFSTGQAKGAKFDEKEKDEQNRTLNVGMSLNRTFVVRGSKVGVFKHNDENELEYLTKIPSIKDQKGQLFTPAKAMLHQEDRKLLLLSEHQPEKVFCMDLERGQVVEEWAAGGGMPIRNIGASEKYAQRSDKPAILGVSKNALFTIDPRVSKSERAEGKVYAKPPKFTAIATNGAGQAAIGSEDGEIRLYSDISKNAKTLLPGLGDPVIGIDVTEDGHYILATSSRYLLVIPTLLKDGKKTGFDKSLGKDKPKPTKLQIDPRDVLKHGIKEVDFTPAHFNTGTNIREEWIVTSTGPFIVTWNFKKVKKGEKYAYKIKKAQSNVVADLFRFGLDDQVVVAEPDNAYVELRKPI